MLKQTENQLQGSFRDPSGFVFRHDGNIYRQINSIYKEEYDLLMGSGLYEELAQNRLLIGHEETDSSLALTDLAYRVIKPSPIGFISYPYEWCFSQLRDAAQVTLQIQKRALDHGMILKDASAYNIQFVEGKPILIDTLSFERYEEGRPWVAYRQFCQHFLAPLALMSYRDARLGHMLRTHLDGVPLDLASRLLPRRTWLSFSLLTNIHLHAASQSKYALKPQRAPSRGMSRRGLLGLIENLESAVRGFRQRATDSVWATYYDNTNYDEQAREHKEQLVARYLDLAQPTSVWDLGANTGHFSRIAARRGINTVSFDFDLAAVETNYLECKHNQETCILPLVLDLTNPSPGLGWEHRERASLVERGPTDTILALALIHHLAIGNNLPMDRIARFLRSICSSLIIEFVPKDDSQVQRLLASRRDIFPDYTQSGFEQSFSSCFSIEEKAAISGSSRTIYYMKSKP